MSGWSVQDSLDLYNLPLWADGFFTANQRGNVVACPQRNGGSEIDLKELVDDLRARGYGLPLLIRFNDILRERVREIDGCFHRAMEEYEYEGDYRGVYPIKVNQQAHIVEELLACGRETHLGLEVGSRPEMLAAIAMIDDPEALVICNGYKDEAYIETALLAQKLGRQVVIVADRYHEFETIIRVAGRHGICPAIGVRARLQTRGAGRWAEGGGSISKFGLSTREIMRAVALLRENDMLDSLQLLHFHMGSQVPSIRILKDALREASRIFVELHRLGAPMRYFDAGGGLAIDYDGSNTNFHSSRNYSVREYANDVVASIGEACEKADCPDPVIITESGRALVAHHSVLVFDVLDRNEIATTGDLEPPPESAHEVVKSLHETFCSIQIRNLLEPYHDAIQLREEAQQHFNLGYLDLEGRAQAERLFFACCGRIQKLLTRVPRVPEELEGLERALADTYYCNFSVFQSMPDSWAVGQLFPIMPVHRLAQRPSRKAVLVDLTCDSDGKVDQFVDLHDVRKVIDLHVPGDDPYYLGVFLVGAYQEILGDLHNLFGDTNAIHVTVDDTGDGPGYRIDHVVVGDTVAQVLDYVEFDRRDLLRNVRRACENAARAGRMTLEETRALLRRYEEGLNAYTYLVAEGDGATPEPPRVSESKRRSDSSPSDEFRETPAPRAESPMHPDAS
jgi:arginine decarboxylase